MTAKIDGGSHSREIRARRLKFAFKPNGTEPEYYMDGDVAMSHLVSLLSSAFPPGEEFFIRSVRRNVDAVSDAQLKKQVQGFIGQEVTHGREHRNLNEQLASMGYPALVADKYSYVFEAVEKLIPRLVPLAITAAAEHYTAILAERVLTNETVKALTEDQEIKHLLMWHAFEELEHKAVAFDVYRANDGGEAIRIAAMAGMTLALYGVGLAAVVASMATDPGVRSHPITALRSLRQLPQSPLIRGLLPEAVKYLRLGFHPDDMDTEKILEEWREELFGAEGELAQNMR